ERGQIDLAAGEPQLAGLAAVHEHDGQGVQVLGGEDDAATGPGGGAGDFAAVPGGGDPGGPGVPPAWGGEVGLGVVLQIVGDAGQGAGDLEVAPVVPRGFVRVGHGGLPAPQPVDRDAFARRSDLACGLLEAPDGPGARGQGGEAIIGASG